MRSRRQFLTTAITTSATLLLGACQQSAAGGTPAPQAAASASAVSPVSSPSAIPSIVAGQLQTLKLGTVLTISHAPVIISQNRGYFAQEGLNVDVTQFGSGAEIVAPLGTGQIDVGSSITPSAGLINAAARGVTIRITANNGSIRPNRSVASILVRRDLQPGDTPVELSSIPRPVRAAALAEGLLPHAILMIQAQQAGVPPADISMSYMGFPDMNAAFGSKNLDIAASGEPLITLAVQQNLATRWKPMADLVPDAPYSNILFGPNLLQKGRDAGMRFVRAYLRGVRDFEDAFSKGRDKDAIVAMIADPLRVPPPLLDAVQQQGGLVFIDPDGTINLAPLQPIVAYWTSTAAIQPGFDLTSLADPAFVAAAVQQLGSYQR